MSASTAQAPVASAGLTASSPAYFASIFGLLVGTVMALGGVYMLVSSSTPITLDIALICAGAMEFAASFYTLKRIRVAWAFAISINGTAFVVFLFTSARLRDATDAHIAVALLPAIIFAALVVLQTLHNEEF
jgi:hypothetical protein